MQGLQFTSTKTNWNTQEINHHHLPPSLPPSLQQYKPTSACSYGAGSHILPQRTSEQHRALCVIYMKPDISWKAHLSSILRKNRSPLNQNIHCWYWFWIHTVMALAFFQLSWFQCSLAGILMYSKAMELTKLISQLGMLKPKSSTYNSKAYLH